MNRILLFLFSTLICIAGINAQVIYDWETPETSNNFQHFGSTLNETLAPIIANPNPSGENTSATVLELVKPANSEPFAGVFALDPKPAIDATNGGKVCVDVHMDRIGNLMLKLEQSSTGAPDWELIVENTVVNGWEQLCFSMSLPGSNGSTPPIGNVFNQHVFFTDFNQVFDADQVTYLDNVVFEEDDTVIDPVDVTFSVDMNEYGAGFGTVFVAGTFNEFSADANPMTDDGNGIWSTTLSLTPGAYEYKFQVDNWADQEMLRTTDQCVRVATGAAGEIFINRALTVLPDTELSTVCWGSCYTCADRSEITWNLGVPTPSPDGVWLAGGAEFGPAGGVYQMFDEDGDGVYSITIERSADFSTFYTFTNGNCPGFECKEDISGQECANPDNFNDRFLEAGTTEINTCFGQCATSTDECQAAPTTTVTFTVNTKDIQVDAGGMLLAGQFANNFQEDLPMTDNGDDTWSYTTTLPKQGWEFKYKNGPDGWEPLEAGTECTVTTPDGAFTNRFIDLTDAGDEVNVTPYCFGTCDICAVGTVDLSAEDAALKVFPTSTADMINVSIEKAYTDGTLSVYNSNGSLVYTAKIDGALTTVDASTYTAGLYIVTLSTDEYVATRRFVKQ